MEKTSLELHSGEVIEVNFGKEERETVHKFARLMGLVEEHERDIIKNPIKHLERASNELGRLQSGIREAIEATYPTVELYNPSKPPSLEFDIIRVDRREYERMKRAIAIIMALG